MTVMLPPLETMRKAIRERDERYRGAFIVGVRSTGIFCRPGCPARVPLDKNMEFFPSASEALFAGYRACKRCDPCNLGRSVPIWAQELCNAVESADGARIRERDLRDQGLTPESVRRWFKRQFGVTFAAYQRAHRVGRAMQGVKSGVTAIEAGLDSGYESTSGLRDACKRLLGDPPSKASGSNIFHIEWFQTPLGAMTGVADNKALVLLEFVDRPMLETQIKRVRSRFGAALVPGTNEILRLAQSQLAEYFEGSLKDFSVPLQLEGTPFQQSVWNALLEVPFGATSTYAAMARQVGEPNAVRAVGRANGDNRLAIIVPCHRIIGSDGKLTGYGGGIWRKRWLLDHESGQRRL